jgi:hypothetical protein
VAEGRSIAVANQRQLAGFNDSWVAAEAGHDGAMRTKLALNAFSIASATDFPAPKPATPEMRGSGLRRSTRRRAVAQRLVSSS